MVTALVPCAGFGTRLGTLTSNRPKPLLEVGGRPLVEHIIRNLAFSGIKRIGINLHFMPKAIPARIGNGSGFGISIDYIREKELLGTAGTARKMWTEGLTQGPLLVNYGDVITDMNLQGLMELHQSSKAWATIVVHKRKKSNSLVETDSEGWVTRFVERPEEEHRKSLQSDFVFSGICILSPECLESIPDTVPCDLPRDVFQNLAGDRKLMALELDAYRCAIDSRERLKSANDAWCKGLYRPCWREELAA